MLNDHVLITASALAAIAIGSATVSGFFLGFDAALAAIMATLLPFLALAMVFSYTRPVRVVLAPAEESNDFLRRSGWQLVLNVAGGLVVIGIAATVGWLIGRR